VYRNEENLAFLDDSRKVHGRSEAIHPEQAGRGEGRGREGKACEL
jgi:hypothetical protein